jgi:RNA polymerase sigma factor (sigma-70 family)
MGPPVARDEAWFTRTYATHYVDIVNYGRRRLADMEAAAELAQEVFVVAWRRRAEAPEHSLPWLYGVARRLLANHWRRRTETPVPDPALIARDVTVAGPSAALLDVRNALAHLAEPDQEILRLVGWEELSVAEAAHVLGCSRAAAAVRLHRARRRLIAAMEQPTHPLAPITAGAEL